MRIAQFAFDESANFFVFRSRPDDCVALEDAFRIGIDNEDGQLARIKENGVRSLGTDALQFQKLGAQGRKRLRKHAGERAAVTRIEERNECFEA